MIVPAPRGDDARLHRVSRAARRPPAGRRGRATASVAPGGDAELRLDQVDAGHLLGDRVLDLDARVALDEEVLAGLGRRRGTRRCRRSRSSAARASRTASARMRSRSVGSRPGAGAISTTFWLRSCTEQSRSCRCTTLPCASARTCTSMWRGRSITLLEEHASRRRTRPAPRCGSARRPRPCSSAASTRAHAAPAAAGGGLEHHRVAEVARDAAASSAEATGSGAAGHDRDAERLARARAPAPCRRTARAPPAAGRRTSGPRRRSSSANSAFSERKP